MLLAVGGDELAVLLVGQGLERRRVEGLAAGRQGPVHGVVGHQGLARAGRGGHQHRVARVEGVEGLVLEVVEGEGQVGLELRRPGRLLDRPWERRSTAEQLPDADGDEVEDDERDGQRQHGERVGARGEDGGDHDDDDDGPAPGARAAAPASRRGRARATPGRPGIRRSGRRSSSSAGSGPGTGWGRRSPAGRAHRPTSGTPGRAGSVT